VRLHARIAEALEELYGANADEHAAELARHFGEAEALLGSDKLVRYSLGAGEAALAAHAHEQALAHFERALGAKDGQPMDDETAALFFGLGRAQLAALERYELEPAVASLRRAFEHYAQADDVSRAVTVAAHPIPFSLGLGYTDFAELIAQALNLVSPDSHEAGRLLAQHGLYSGLVEADYDAAQQAFQRAQSIAQRQGDGALERTTLANAAWVDVWHFHSQGGLKKALSAIELAGRAADENADINARRSAVWALTAMGEREQVRSHTAEALAVAERLRDRWWLASASFDNARLSAYEGDWQAARRMSDVSSAAQPRDPRPLAIRALLEYEVGDFVEGAARLERLCQVTRGVQPPGPIAEHVFLAGVIPLTERISGNDERLELAQTVAANLLSLPRLAPVFALVARSGLGLIAVQRRDATAAEPLYRAIESQRGTAGFIVPLVFDRLLGLLAVTFGRIDTALTHFEDALAFCEGAGYRPEYAWTACDYAEALLARGGSSDRDHAVALEDLGLATARELEMRPLMERILARREILTA
jgi:tetratricopeptide (TPR) repeat protein